jgi:hypothetical protein
MQDTGSLVAEWEYHPMLNPIFGYRELYSRTGISTHTRPIKRTEGIIVFRGVTTVRFPALKALAGLTVFNRVIEEPLWAGNSKSLTIYGKAFNKIIGWGDNT